LLSNRGEKVALGCTGFPRGLVKPHNGSTLSAESALVGSGESTAISARPHELPFPEPDRRRN
jgi:hypothetical protein